MKCLNIIEVLINSETIFYIKQFLRSNLLLLLLVYHHEHHHQ